MSNSSDRISVLLVDEDAEFTATVAEYLRHTSKPFDVSTAGNAAEALQTLTTSRINCIVADYHLPGQSGLDLLSEVRAKYGDLPFILYTGNGSEDIASEAIHAGVTDYLQKSIGADHFDRLVNRCQHAVQQYRAEQRSDALARIRSASRAVEKALLRSDSTDELQQNVCDVLVDIDSYQFAWVGIDDSDTTHIVPRSAAGAAQDYLEDLVITTDDRVTGQGPTGRAVTTGEIQVIQDIEVADEYEPWRAAALGHGFHSSAAVPFDYPDGRTGILNVYSDSPHTFDESDRELLSEISDDISHTLGTLEMQHELRRTTARLEAILENSPNMIDIHDGAGRILGGNRRFFEQLGYPESDLVGDPVWKVDVNLDPDEAEAIWAEMAVGDRYELESQYRHRDGSTFPVEVHLQRLRIDDDDRFVVVSRDITERKQREREREQIISRVTDAIVQVDEQWRFTFVDERAEALYGMTEEDLLGVSFWDVFPEALGTRFEEEYRSVMQTREPTSFEEYYEGLDGWFDIQAYPDDGGGISFYFRETTDRRNRQQALAEERKRFRALAQTATDAIIIVDTDNTIVYANDALERIFGHTPGDVEGEPVTKLMPPRFREDHIQGIRRYLETGERRLDWENVRFPGAHADGQEVPLELSFTEYESGEGPLIAAIIRDISDRLSLEEELRTEKNVLERVFATSPIGITVVGASGETLRANEMAEEELGLTRSEILSRTYDASEWELVDEDGEELPLDEYPIERVLQTGEVVEGYRMGIRVGGDQRWLSVSAAPIDGDDSEPVSVVTTFQDITDRVEYERKLERYRTIVQTTSDPIFLLDSECRFIEVNEALANVTGRSTDELIGTHLSKVADSESVEHVEHAFANPTSRETAPSSFETSLTDGQGTSRQHAVSLVVLREDEQSEIAVCIAHDVTDLRENQRRLSVLDRVLRHNLRNKLNVIAAHAEALSKGTDSTVQERATTILETTMKLMDLSNSAREFQGVLVSNQLQTDVIDVSQVVESIVTEARLEYPDAKISADRLEEAPIKSHQSLELAIDELVTNAIVHNDRDEPSVRLSVSVQAETARICVSDDGPGLDEFDRDVLFRGFETPLEHTQGLGLWLVRWTVEQLNGDIDITENDPRGTAIRIELPLHVG